MLAKLVEFFAVDFDPGRSSMATTTNDGILGKFNCIGEIKITKAPTRPLIDTVCCFGQNKGGPMIFLNQTSSDNTKNPLMPLACFDNDGLSAWAVIFDSLKCSFLFSFTFFVQLLQFFY